MPKTRVTFWKRKFDDNVRRDERVIAALRHQGWEVLVIWECETSDEDLLRRTLLEFLG